MFITIECDMQEFIAGCAKRFCPQCGVEIKTDRRHSRPGRPRVFCSSECRRTFWKAHPRVEAWDSFEEHVCPVCGKVFFGQRETKRQRKYCSRSCANRGRAMHPGTAAAALPVSAAVSPVPADDIHLPGTDGTEKGEGDV